MTNGHGLIILENERHNLKTENSKNSTLCEDNSRMSEENDGIEVGFIYKHLGNMRRTAQERDGGGGIMINTTLLILWLASDLFRFTFSICYDTASLP